MENLHSLFLKSSGVQTDTRKINPNCLFFCLKGERFNGNTFAHEALKMGALAVVIDEEEFVQSEQTILVKDVLQTLQGLANYHRKKMSIPIIAITGSNGKTTTKELTEAVLSTEKNVLATKGNLNNHIGVPLTLLEITVQHEIAIIEMGANKPGDIKELVEIAEPTHGIITNVGRAHLEGFGSLEGVIQTKTEMYQYLNHHKGKIFINGEDSVLMKEINKTSEIEILYYNTLNSIQGNLTALNPFVVMNWSEEGFQSEQITTQLIGEYNFTNFLAAITIGRHFNISQSNCSKAIENYSPSNNRSQVTKTKKNTLIVDCYNANPSSMRSAIDSFARMEAYPKFFVLGDMLEMGQDSAMVHEEIVQLTIDHRLSGFFVGEEFLKCKGMHPQALFLKSTEPLQEHFEMNPTEDCTILLKGSRGIALEKLIPLL